MRYTDPNSYASSPGGLGISRRKWKQIKKTSKLGFFERLAMNTKKGRINHYIKNGDTQPAIVISVNPLKVAVYSDEMDAVVILWFPNEYAKIYNLTKYSRLISVNVYQWKGNGPIKNDIFIGENYLGRYSDFTPTIGDFLSDNTQMIAIHKLNIPENVWSYVKELAENYVNEHPKLSRKGFWFNNEKYVSLLNFFKILFFTSLFLALITLSIIIYLSSEEVGTILFFVIQGIALVKVLKNKKRN